MSESGTTDIAANSTADLLVELGCEELPPKSLHRLAHAFSDAVRKGLGDAGLTLDSSGNSVFYTPRRLGFRLVNVSARQADQLLDRRGPAISAAFDAQGQPTPAALGFARSVGLDVQALDRQKSANGEWLFCRIKKPGLALVDVLYPVLEKALAGLPVARPMRWSDHDFSFVRPVHWLLVLHGSDVLDGALFGVRAGRETRGHRVHSPGPHPVASANDYQTVLQNAYVLVDPAQRKQRINELAEEAGRKAGGETRITDVLLDEVTNIIEWPVALNCSFAKDFLEIPPEALIASMEDHQKVFPILNSRDGSLTAGFVVISNLESTDLSMVRDGFERVIRPRLADARFFWDQDRKFCLEDPVLEMPQDQGEPLLADRDHPFLHRGVDVDLGAPLGAARDQQPRGIAAQGLLQHLAEGREPPAQLNQAGAEAARARRSRRVFARGSGFGPRRRGVLGSVTSGHARPPSRSCLDGRTMSRSPRIRDTTLQSPSDRDKSITVAERPRRAGAWRSFGDCNIGRCNMRYGCTWYARARER